MGCTGNMCDIFGDMFGDMFKLGYPCNLGRGSKLGDMYKSL